MMKIFTISILLSQKILLYIVFPLLILLGNKIKFLAFKYHIATINFIANKTVYSIVLFLFANKIYTFQYKAEEFCSQINN
jgi:hypothetical protein